MTALRERPMTEVTRMPTRQSHVTEWILGIAGALAAGFGAWMYYVPTDWFLGGLVEGWPFGLFIAAGLLLATAFGIFVQKTYSDEGRFTGGMVLATVLGLAALGGAIAFTVIWIV